jgi:hypothetical protein
LAQPLVVLVLELVELCLAVALVPLVGPKLVRLLVGPVAAEPHLLLMARFPVVAQREFRTPRMRYPLRMLALAPCPLCREWPNLLVLKLVQAPCRPRFLHP